MIFKVRQKIFNIRGTSDITDENGRACYFVNTNIELFATGKRFSLLDLNGHEIYFAKERLMRIKPRYDLYPSAQSAKNDKENSRLGVFKKKLLTLPVYRYKSKYGNYKISGNLGWTRTFKIKKNGKLVGTIQKKLLKVADTYMVNVPEISEAPMVLTLALVLDEIHHKGR